MSLQIIERPNEQSAIRIDVPLRVSFAYKKDNEHYYRYATQLLRNNTLTLCEHLEAITMLAENAEIATLHYFETVSVIAQLCRAMIEAGESIELEQINKQEEK